MGSEAVAISPSTTFALPSPPRRISWKEFRRNYLTREDDFKYEWVDGKVEKTPRTMEKRQLFVFDVLDDLLEKLQYSEGRKISGKLIPEPDIFFDGKHRRPDIAFFTKEQIQAAKRDEEVVPQFVIEVISKNDQVILVEEKMENYQAAKVSVVWQIMPSRKMVKEIRGNTTKTLTGDDICSAEPVIEGFLISVNDIFK